MLHPHPTIIKKIKTFLEVEVKMGSIPVPAPGNQFRPSLPETNPNVRKNDVTEKEREQHPRRSLGQPPPKLQQHALPYQRLHQSLRIAHPYHQYQQEKTPHDPVQARCQEIILRTEIGCSLKTIWPLKIRMRV